MKRTFFHPGSTKCEEQKREAREDYGLSNPISSSKDRFPPFVSSFVEERCERRIPLFRNTGTRRYCPDIHDWKDLDTYEIGDGWGGLDPLHQYEQDTTTTARNQYDRYRRPVVGSTTTTTNNPVDDPELDD